MAETKQSREQHENLGNLEILGQDSHTPFSFQKPAIAFARLVHAESITHSDTELRPFVVGMLRAVKAEELRRSMTPQQATREIVDLRVNDEDIGSYDTTPEGFAQALIDLRRIQGQQEDIIQKNHPQEIWNHTAKPEEDF